MFRVSGDYLRINRENWDSRAPIHAQNYGIDALLADPDALSGVVRFDLPRLGRLDGLDVVHLQCHIGTDTLSLARLGAASVTGVDLSPVSLGEARRLAAAAGTSIDYVEADVYSAPDALGRQFDLVYTGIGAICWLPRIDKWAQTVAALLRPGGRLLVLEFSQIWKPLAPAYDFYSFKVIPRIGELITQDEASYRYLAESIRVHPDQETLKGLMEQAGLEKVEYFNLSLGVVALHRGFKF